MTQPQSGWGQGWGKATGPGPAKLKGSRPIALYVIGLVVVAVLALAVINALTPPPPPPRCPPGQSACNPPPPVPGSSATPPPIVSPETPAPTAPGGPTSSAPPYVAYTSWSSSDGWGFHHYPSFTVTATDQRTFADLAGNNAFFKGVSVRVEGQRSSASDLIKSLRDETGPPAYESVAVDDQDRDAILQPFLGQRPGSAVVLRGTTSEAGGVRPVAIVIVAAADGDLAIGIRVVIPQPDTFTDPKCDPKTDDCERRFRGLGSALDSIAKRISWPGQP